MVPGSRTCCKFVAVNVNAPASWRNACGHDGKTEAYRRHHCLLDLHGRVDHLVVVGNKRRDRIVPRVMLTERAITRGCGQSDYPGRRAIGWTDTKRRSWGSAVRCDDSPAAQPESRGRTGRNQVRERWRVAVPGLAAKPGTTSTLGGSSSDFGFLTGRSQAMLSLRCFWSEPGVGLCVTPIIPESSISATARGRSSA